MTSCSLEIIGDAAAKPETMLSGPLRARPLCSTPLVHFRGAERVCASLCGRSQWRQRAKETAKTPSKTCSNASVRAFHSSRRVTICVLRTTRCHIGLPPRRVICRLHTVKCLIAPSSCWSAACGPTLCTLRTCRKRGDGRPALVLALMTFARPILSRRFSCILLTSAMDNNDTLCVLSVVSYKVKNQV